MTNHIVMKKSGNIMSLQVKTRGVIQLKGLMTKIGKGIQDFTPTWKKIAASFKKIEAEQFAAQGKKSKWAPLSPAYAAYKAKKYPGRPILVQDGNLKRSLTTGNEDTIMSVSPLILKLGTKNKLGIIHQTGTGKMPARKLIDITAGNTSKWMTLVKTFIADLIGGK